MRVALSILLVLLVASCDYIDNLTTSSEIITQSVEIETVEKIIINTPCKLILSNSEETDLTITGQEHLLNDLTVDYQNNSLSIDHRKSDYLQKSKLIELYITANALKNITINKVMTLTSDEAITSRDLNIIVNGTAKFTEVDLSINNSSTILNIYGFNNSGNYIIEGSTNQFLTNIEGSVNVYADQFISNKVKVRHKSIGECNVYAHESLDVETYSSGNTYYDGEPNSISHEQIQISKVKPTGKLIKLKYPAQ